MVHMIMKAMIENAAPVKNLVESIKETAMVTLHAKETLFVEIIIVLCLFQVQQTAVLIPESLKSPNSQIPDSPFPWVPESANLWFADSLNPLIP